MSGNMSFAGWIKTSTSRTEAIFSKYDSAGSESGYMLKINPNGFLSFQVGHGNLVSGTREVFDTTKINDGNWHYITTVVTIGQDVKFYVDGSLSSSQSLNTMAGNSNAPFQIGSEPFGYYGAWFTGALDEVRIYNQALSANDVKTIMNLAAGQVKGEAITSGLTEAQFGQVEGSGRLYQIKGDSAIYLILSDGTKYAFTSMKEFTSFGYKLSMVIHLRPNLTAYFNGSYANATSKLTAHPTGTFIKYANSPKVYVIDNGYKRLVTSSKVLLQYTNFAHVLTVSKAFVYPDGEPLF
jgi:hypothetical protein